MDVLAPPVDPSRFDKEKLVANVEVAPIGARSPEKVNKGTVGVGWRLRRDMVRAALFRTSLPVYGGTVRSAITTGRTESAR